MRVKTIKSDDRILQELIIRAEKARHLIIDCLDLNKIETNAACDAMVGILGSVLRQISCKEERHLKIKDWAELLTIVAEEKEL